MTDKRDPEPGEPMQASCADSGTSNVKFHAVRKVSGPYGYWAACCGTGSDGTTSMSDETVPAKSIKASDRCNKAGCRKAFALADAAELIILMLAAAPLPKEQT